MPDDPPDSWVQYRKLILSELERISTDLTKLAEKLDNFKQDEISQIKVDIAMLKVKAGAWGVAGGLIVAVGAALIGQLK